MDQTTPPAFRIGLIAGGKGPSDAQTAWMKAEIKKRVAFMQGKGPVLLYPCRTAGNAPSWILRSPRPQGSEIVKDGLPNWAGRRPGAHPEIMIVEQLEQLNLDLIWCFAGAGQTAFGASIASQTYRRAISFLPHQQAIRYQLIPSWIGVNALPSENESLNKPSKRKEPALWNR